MHLVAGATGLLGSAICEQLSRSKKKFCALVRKSSDPAKVARLRALGAEIVHGDLKDPASLKAACRGVSDVLSTVSSTFSRQEGDSIATVDREGQIALIDAATSAGVKRFLLVSFSMKPGLDCALSEAKQAAENRLMASGMSWVILRAGFFMDVWLSPMLGFDAAGGSARIYGPGRNPLSWIAVSDLAEYAVRVLDVPAAMNRIINVGGPQALSPLEVVKAFEDVTGKKFQTEHVPLEALEAQRAAATDPMQHSFATLMLVYAGGDPMDMTEPLRLVPLKMTTVRSHAQRTVRGQSDV